MFSYYTWLSRSGCRRETALPPALYPHLKRSAHYLFSQQVPWSLPLGVANRVIAVDHSLPLLVQTSKNVRDVVGEEPKLFGIDFCVSSIESHFVT